MIRDLFCKELVRSAAVAVAIALPALSQTGNELVFVGTSLAGSTDPFVCVESATGAIASSGNGINTDNVSNAFWTDTGRRIYAAQGLQQGISLGEWDGTNMTWSTFYSTLGSCWGIEHDMMRKRIWAYSGSGELECVDADPDSPTYGLNIAQATFPGTRERWGLSASGNLAALPDAFLGQLTVVDTDPISPTYLQSVVNSFVPGLGGFSLTVGAEISVDDSYVFVLYAGLGTEGIAVYDLLNSQWLDFDTAPGHQNLIIPLSTPNTLDLALNYTTAVVSGQGGGGWVVRIDFDFFTPSNSSITQLGTLASLPECAGASLSADATRVAVTSEITSSTGELTILDVATGAVLQQTTLPGMWNLYTTAWQDASPVGEYSTFGAGCAGTLGVPTLAPTPGSRPAMGDTFSLTVGNLPFGFGAMLTGLSAAITSTGIPLPLDLGIIGMPGCDLLADNLVIDVIVGGGSTAKWVWSIPDIPNAFGFQFANQALSFDPAANAFGFTASNGGLGTVGF